MTLGQAKISEMGHQNIIYKGKKVNKSDFNKSKKALKRHC